MFSAPISKRFAVTPGQYDAIVAQAKDNESVTNLKFSDIGAHAGSLTMDGEIDLSFVFDGVGSLLVTVDKNRGFPAHTSTVFDQISRKLLTVVPPPPAAGQPNVKVPIRPPFGVTSGYPHVLEGSLEKAIPQTGVEATDTDQDGELQPA